jgi:transposase
MLKNRKLARAVSDAGWSRFLRILKHKAKVGRCSVHKESAECVVCGAIQNNRCRKVHAPRTPHLALQSWRWSAWFKKLFALADRASLFWLA